MIWSVSKGKMFTQCQRKWLYYEVIASSRSNDPLRKEAHLLKQLQSVSAWRGSIVDTIIHEKIYPRLRTNQLPDTNEIFTYADDLIERQLQFGKENGHRQDDISKTMMGDNYCAFYDLEYNGSLDDRSIQTAKKEVKDAIEALLDSSLLKEIAEGSEHVISQRPLIFKISDFQVTSTPDMVVFFEDKPPEIIDWKVHYFGNSDAWLQLGIYSLALSRVKPHRDFPDSFKNHKESPETFKLLEYQLLKNIQRNYSLKSDDILDLEDHIFRSASQMTKVLNGKKYDDLDLSVFKTALRPQICGRCQFKKLCWAEQEPKGPKPLQQTLLGVFK